MKLLLIVIYVFIQLYYKDLKVDCKAMWGSIRPEKMITNKKRSNFEKKKQSVNLHCKLHYIITSI